MVALPLLVVASAAQAAGNGPGDYAVTAVHGRAGAPDRQRALDPDQVPGGAAPQRLVSMTLASDLDIGLGMFSVVGSTEKEMVRRRTDPLPDVRTRESRVAAVGFSLRF